MNSSGLRYSVKFRSVFHCRHYLAKNVRFTQERDEKQNHEQGKLHKFLCTYYVMMSTWYFIPVIIKPFMQFIASSKAPELLPPSPQTNRLR